MPHPSLVLWVDSTSNRLLSGWQSNSNASTPVLRQGDSAGVEIHWISTFNGGAMVEVPFPDSVAMTLAIGRLDAPPTAGTFRIAYGANVTADIPYGVTDAQLTSAINALPLIAAEGGVTATKVATSYRVIWNNAVVPSFSLQVGSNELFPTSSIGIANVRAGSVSVRQIYQVHIKQSPVCNATSFVAQDPATATLSVLHSPSFAGDNKVWRMSIDPQPRDGTFTISYVNNAGTFRTTPASVDITALNLQSLLKAQTDESWNVIKSGTYSWDISSPSTDIVSMTVNGNGIISFNSAYGVMDLNTAEVEDLLAGQASATANIELEVQISGVRQTLFQSPCTILNDLIDSDLYTTVRWGDVLPVDSVVRFDTSQSLSEPQKAQARANIGTITTSDLNVVVGATDALEMRVSSVEAVTLTAYQKAAINAETTLNTSNPVASHLYVDTGLSGKAATIHTHEITDVNNLRGELDNKANTLHNHSISEITGLQTALDDKATVSHTHTSFGLLSVSALTVVESLALPSASLIQNTFSSPIIGFYDSEITVTINGIQYAIPARVL